MKRIFAILLIALCFFCGGAFALPISTNPALASLPLPPSVVKPALPPSNPAVPTVRFGVFYFYPPFVYSTSTGFDINIAQALCRQMKVNCVFENYTPSEIFKALDQGKIDAIISALSITESRKQRYLFTDPYYISSMSFLGRNEVNNHVTFDELAKKKIGVIDVSIFNPFLHQAFPKNNKIKLYPRNSELLLALVDKDVDVVVMDTPVAEYWQRQSDCKLKLLGQPVMLPNDQGYGIVLRHDSSILQASLNQALNEIKANGKYDQIVAMYFDKMPKNDACLEPKASNQESGIGKIKQFLSKLT